MHHDMERPAGVLFAGTSRVLIAGVVDWHREMETPKQCDEAAMKEFGCR